MVYELLSDGSVRSFGQRPYSKIKLPQWHIQIESIYATLLIKTIKLLLFVYDTLSRPVYFVLQRPDKRNREAQRVRSERVDANTWIRTSLPRPLRHLLHDYHAIDARNSCSRSARNQVAKYKYMGATLGEIFANSIDEFSDRPCLGYRAVVTCPVMSLDENGEHVMRDKSFRTDYTWYTYEQIGRRVQDIASGLYYHSIYPGSRSLFLASTCLEWFCASQACFQLACKVVLAPEINDSSSLGLLLNEAEIDVIFVSCDNIRKLCAVFKSIGESSCLVLNIKRVVIIDWQFKVDFGEPAFVELRDSARHMVDSILSMAQIEETGIENPIELLCTKSLRECGQDQQDPLIDSRRISRTTRKSSMDSPHNRELNKSKSPNSPKTTQSLSCRNSPGSLQHFSGKMLAENRRLSTLSADASVTAKQMKQRSSSSGSSPKLRMHISQSLQSLTGRTRAKPDDTAIILYNHGSLGQIKALALTQSYLARSNHYLFLDGVISGQDVHCATLALDNVIEFMLELCIFSHGGSIGYSCGSETLFYDGKDLFKRDKSDLEALNPTFLLVRPYILESFRSSVQDYLNLEMNPLISFLMTNIIYDYKKYWTKRHYKTPILDRLFCWNSRRLFGVNVRYILCNGATDCSETKDFFAFMLNIPVIELYGPDESLVSMMSVDDVWDYKRRLRSNRQCDWKHFCWTKADMVVDDDNYDEQSGDFFELKLLPPKVDRNTFKADSSKNLLATSSILCPALGARIRLEDWEDFRTSDLPFPRGRLVIGGDVVCKGYFKRPELTKRSFYSDSNSISWFRTEDIARVFPNGGFEIISAVSNMTKLVDGQFVSLSQIEHILRNSQFVDNVCAICGDDRRFVVALVVPNLRRLALKSPGEANLKAPLSIEPEPEELIDVEFRREVCNDRLLCEFVAGHLQDQVLRAGLKAVPNRFLLVPEIWTPETELVTPSYEPKRLAIQKYYATDIQSIFKMEFSGGTRSDCRHQSSQGRRSTRGDSSPMRRC